MVINNHCGFNSPERRHPEFGGFGFVDGLEIVLDVEKSITLPGPLFALKVKLGVLQSGIALIQLSLI